MYCRGMTGTAAIYTRISNDPTGREFGVTRQLEDCQALAERLGWDVVATHTDNDLSAYNGKTRPGFEAMLDGMKRGEFDALICWHTDRLYRSMKDLERLIDVADAGRVQLRTVNGGDLDLSNSSGRMLARILGSVARQESEHKGERQKRANAQRADTGSWWSSNRCFGYTQAGEPLEPEAAMIRAAAADVLAGTSLRAIARQWNESGVASTRGAQWNTSRLKRLLINPRYAALRTYRGKITGPGDWEAVLDADTHTGLLAVLRDPERGGAVSYERKYIGSHRFICGICRAPMEHAMSTHADGRTFHRYRCTAAAHLSRTQPELDNLVEGVVLGYLNDDTKLAALLAHDDKSAVDLDELRTRRAALVARKDELATLFTDGVLDGPAVRRESGNLTAKIGSIDSALAGLVRRNPVADLVKDGPELVETRWSALTPDLKGKFIDELFTVVVHPAPRGRYFKPEFVEFVWKQ
jgi:site-specific DNA recombinase